MKIFDDHIEAESQLKYWKARENELRIKICDKLLEGKSAGTHTIHKGKYEIKATKKVSHGFDEEQLNFIWSDLSEEEQGAIKFKPSLLLKEYKSLSDHEVLDQAIVVKPAMPTLKITLAE